MNDLKQAMCQIVKGRDMMGLLEMFNENQTKKNSDLLLQSSRNGSRCWI